MARLSAVTLVLHHDKLAFRCKQNYVAMCLYPQALTASRPVAAVAALRFPRCGLKIGQLSLTSQHRALGMRSKNSESDSDWLDRLECIASEDDTAPKRMRNRPSKSRAKRVALQSHELAAKLSQLTENQLALLEPLLDDDIVEAVQISSRIDGKNQGRRRQEQLIGKMLREYPGPGLGELQGRVDAALSGATSSPDDILSENTALAWREALLAGDKSVEVTVCDLAVQLGLDTQQLRTGIMSSRREAEQAQRLIAEAEAASSDTPMKSGKQMKPPNKHRKALLKTMREIAAFQATSS